MATEPKTIREKIFWSYANLARAHAALEDGALKYKKIHHIIRNRLYNGLVSDEMSIGSLVDDERLKMTTAQACQYCGSTLNLAVDHLIPKIRGGSNDANNLVWACRSCNGSKQGRDMLSWMATREDFPSIFVLRRYLKIVAQYCEDHDYMHLPLGKANELDTPFDLNLLPTKFPPLSELKLLVSLTDP